MADAHVSYEEIAAARRGSAEYRERYVEARRAFLIGQAIRERRLALGLSQAEVAARAGIRSRPCHGWRRAARCRRSPCWSGSPWLWRRN